MCFNYKIIDDFQESLSAVNQEFKKLGALEIAANHDLNLLKKRQISLKMDIANQNIEHVKDNLYKWLVAMLEEAYLAGRMEVKETLQ